MFLHQVGNFTPVGADDRSVEDRHLELILVTACRFEAAFHCVERLVEAAGAAEVETLGMASS
jgi:hypothetical protein